MPGVGDHERVARRNVDLEVSDAWDARRRAGQRNAADDVSCCPFLPRVVRTAYMSSAVGDGTVARPIPRLPRARALM